MKTNRYRKLDVYQEAKLLVKNVYLHLQQFPKEEQFALCDQLRRAVISIPSNSNRPYRHHALPPPCPSPSPKPPRRLAV